MGRLSRIALLCLAAMVILVIVGCATSADRRATEADRLDRWLEGAPADESEQAPAGLREPAPPRQVPLESLEVSGEPLLAIDELPRPDYFSFELTEPGYVSVAARSQAGAAIELIDRSSGSFAQSGRAGTSDGRVDTLLDSGEYRVEVQTAHQRDEAQVTVHEFVEVQTDSELLMNTPPGTLHSFTLGDYEQRSFWVRVTPEDPLILEAMGRALRAVRIWKDGVWVTERQPVVSTYSPLTGQPMGYVQFSDNLDPGTYLVSFYGGEVRAWEEDAEGSPFYVRRGARYLGGIVDAQTVISPMGRDAFLVSGDVTVMEIENQDFVPARVGISRFGSGSDRYSAQGSASIRRSDESTRARGTVSRSSSRRWLFVEGTPGDTVRLRAIPYRTEYQIDEPDQGSRYLISTISTLDSDHAADATPIILREGTRNTRDEVIRSEALELSGEPLVREINVPGPVFFFVDLTSSGQWAFVHDRPDDARVGVAILPLRDIAGSSRPDILTENPAIFDLPAGQHMVMIQPSPPGVLGFSLYRRTSAASDRRAAALLDEAAPLPRADVSYVTSRNEISAGIDHLVVANDRGGVTSALFVQQLPLDMVEPVPLTLEPGQELSFDVSPSRAGIISSGYRSVVVQRNGGTMADGDILPAGRTSMTVRNTGDVSRTFVLRHEPVITPSFSAPEIPRVEESLPGLVPGEAVYHDYNPEQAREFLLVVGKPAFYELQTTGRLSTQISVRTRANPNGPTASANGPGRNARIQAYFRPGSYLVEVRTSRPSEGRAGLIMSPLPMHDLGHLSEETRYSAELDAGVGLRGSVAVRTAGQFSFRTVGLYGSPTTRLEDADAWPVSAAYLTPGTYTYFSWPQSVWNRRLTSFERLPEPAQNPQGAAWELPLNSRHRRTWNETPNRTPHEFFTHSSAPLPATIRVTGGMEWWVTDSQGIEAARGEGSETVILSEGRNNIFVRSKEENNNVGYEISVSTSVLADGLVQSVSRAPAEIPVAVGQDGIYEFWSTGTWDVRAVLETVGEDASPPVILASGDDRPGDWNFHISRYLPEGSYLLRVEESFPGSGAVEIACRRRDEVQVDQQQLPLEVDLALDQTIVGIPFLVGDDAPVRITSDSSAAWLAVYRDDRLIAEGRDSIFISLHQDQEYLLRVRNDALDSTIASVGIAAPELQRLRWDGAGSLTLPAGASEITTGAFTSLILSSGTPQPVLTGAREIGATGLRGGVFANSDNIMWVWNATGADAVAQPLQLSTGQPRVFEITDADVSARIELKPDTISVVEARTVAGYLGLMAPTAGWDEAVRDWSRADFGQSSTLLGLAGNQTRQVWIWDGEPRSEGRSVELSVREFPVHAAATPGAGPLDLAPGNVVVLDASGEEAVLVLLTPDLVAISTRDGETVATVAARGANLSKVIPGGGMVYVVNTGRRNRQARVHSAPAPRELVVDSAGMETLLDRPGTVTARTLPGAASAIGVWSVNPSEVVLLSDSGRRITARPPGVDVPYWTLPAVDGRLSVRAESGPVAAWPADNLAETVSWLSRGAGRPESLREGPQPMPATPQRWEFSLDEEAFVLATTDNRGITALAPGGDQADLAPQVVIGSGTSRQVFAVLGPGNHAVITRSLAAEPQPSPLNLQVLTPISISESVEPASLFLDAGDRAVFQVNVAADGPVGIGLRAETDSFTTYLLDDQLRAIGSGRIYYRDLTEGRYYMLVENGSLPMNATPVVFADQGSRTGVPEDELDGYRGE